MLLQLNVLFLVVGLSFTNGLTFKLSDEDVQNLKIKLNEVTSGELQLLQANGREGSPNIKQNPQNIYAVLVAGSNGYFNYRHQADICHSYQILRRNGVPDENIVVMMYDDIANSTENPTPGVIINRPNGTNVYENIIKDYIGKDVNPETFLKVLLGDEEGVKGIGSGKVLKSGPNDHVFINFVDHGAPGLVAFPDEELHARDLINVLRKMYQQRKYRKLVFYLEACESGSMFKNLLPGHWNIFATTAANSEESSYACYFDSLRKTYLGDVYSVMWMENADQMDLEKETLERQFLLVKEETNTSHVQEFGDRRLERDPVADFLGGYSSERLSYPPVELDAVDSVDVPRILLEKAVLSGESSPGKKVAQLKLSRMHKLRNLVTEQIMEIVSKVVLNDSEERNLLVRSKLSLNNFDCYENVVKYFSKNCFSIAKNPYVTRKLYLFVNMCERGWTAESMIEVMANTCHQNPDEYTGIY